MSSHNFFNHITIFTLILNHQFMMFKPPSMFMLIVVVYLTTFTFQLKWD